MQKVLIFAGTTEGRRFATILADAGYEVWASVATEYGKQMVLEGPHLHVQASRLTQKQMEEWMVRQGIHQVVDATHPFATEVTQNIKAACEQVNCPYMRLLRLGAQNEDEDELIYVENQAEAVAYLKETTGNILLTTGSKELEKYQELTDYAQRCYARVLPTVEVIEKCQQLGFSGQHLIAMQGPFSEELNYGLLKQLQIQYMVTKESGTVGGFYEKIEAAKRAQVKTIVVGRPMEEEGYSFAQCLQAFGVCEKRQITFVGIGMGSMQSMTLEGRKACEQAEVFIGAKRMLEAVQALNRPQFASYQPEEILAFLLEKKEYQKIVILMSGDSGFYSGTEGIIKAIEACEEKDSFHVAVLPGIASISYLAAKGKISWQDAHIISCHGREANVVHAVQYHKKTFLLLDKADSVQKICKTLWTYGWKEVRLLVGEALSYPQEKVTMGTVEEFLTYEAMTPCAMFLFNEHATQPVIGAHLQDEEFLRDKVPMTKQEIRGISIQYLALKEDSVCYDIGAGTGSIAIEMAGICHRGEVYAIERKPEALALLEKNKRKFKRDNLTIIGGEAASVLKDLPTPTHAFIGGSGGELEEILACLLEKNPQMNIVLNAITLETMAKTMELAKKYHRNPKVTQVQIARGKTMGDYHMMIGENPIYIMKLEGEACELS